MQRLTCDELFSDLTLERDAVRSMLRHGFHPPEARQRWSIPFPQSVHPQGRTPKRGPFSTPKHRLANEKLESEAEAVRQEGWKWVEIMPDPGFDTLRSFGEAK